MGFSTVAASVILFAALLFFSSTIANAYFEAQRNEDRVSEEKRARVEFERGTSFELYNGQRAGSTVRLYATNTGSTSLDTDSLHVLIDGVWSTGAITFLRIEGSPSYTTWGPGHDLELRVSVAGQPERAWLVSETGYAALWEL